MCLGPGKAGVKKGGLWDRLYVGGEGEIGLFFFNVSLGYLAKVGGNAASSDGLVSWSLGVGF